MALLRVQQWILALGESLMSVSDPKPPLAILVPTPAVRCHDCGQFFAAEHIERRNVKTGSSSAQLAVGQHYAWASAAHTERVDLCLECLRLRDQKETQDREQQAQFHAKLLQMWIWLGVAAGAMILLATILFAAGRFN